MAKEITAMKVIRWLNSKTGVWFYGLDVKVNGVWSHLIDDDKPCFYNTKKEATVKLKELQQQSKSINT